MSCNLAAKQLFNENYLIISLFAVYASRATLFCCNCDNIFPNSASLRRTVFDFSWRSWRKKLWAASDYTTNDMEKFHTRSKIAQKFLDISKETYLK